VGARLNGHAQRLLGRKALFEYLGSGAQPALLDHFAAFAVQQAQMAVFVPKIYPDRHRWLPSVTIIHGPILSFLWANTQSP
jgi:hypothetical protein